MKVKQIRHDTFEISNQQGPEYMLFRSLAKHVEKDGYYFVVKIVEWMEGDYREQNWINPHIVARILREFGFSHRRYDGYTQYFVCTKSPQLEKFRAFFLSIKK